MTDDTDQDIIIHASAQDLGHKWVAKLGDDERAYWRVNGTPRQTEPGRRIWFEHNERIHAWGEIVELEDGRIWFDGARETHLPCLDDAPTRGFAYIDPLFPRLEETEWHVQDTGEIVMPDGGTDRSSTKKGTGGKCPHCGATRDCGKELQQHIESHNARLSDFGTGGDRGV